MEEKLMVSVMGNRVSPDRTIRLQDDKYQVHFISHGVLIATRYNEIWPAFGDEPIFSSLINAMYHRITELEDLLDEKKSSA